MTFIGCLTNTLLVQVGQFKDLCTSLPYILYEIFLEIIGFTMALGFTLLVVMDVMVSPPFQHIRILKQISSTPKPFFAPPEMEEIWSSLTLVPFALSLSYSYLPNSNIETGITCRSTKTCG